MLLPLHDCRRWPQTSAIGLLWLNFSTPSLLSNGPPWRVRLPWTMLRGCPIEDDCEADLSCKAQARKVTKHWAHSVASDRNLVCLPRVLPESSLEQKSHGTLRIFRTSQPAVNRKSFRALDILSLSTLMLLVLKNIFVCVWCISVFQQDCDSFPRRNLRDIHESVERCEQP